MKAFIITLIMVFSFQGSAKAVSPDQLPIEQQRQFIQFLNGLEPEMLSTIVTEETLDWYIKQFNRAEEQGDVELLKPLHGRLEVTDDAFNDPNAPVFN